MSTSGFPRIFGYVLQVIKYSISVPLDQGGFGGWNLMLTAALYMQSKQTTYSTNGLLEITKDFLETE